MLPPAWMLAIKKRGANGLVLWAVVASGFFFSACAPPGPRALLQGEQLIRQGKYDQAIEKLELATRLLPKQAQAWNHLGLAYHGQQRPEEALRAYRQALALDHKLAAARYNLGCLLLEQNNPTAAIDELTSYTLLQSRSLDGWLRLGAAQLRMRKWETAEKSFKNALELHPRHPEALNGLGIIHLQRKRVPESLNCFNLALAQNPQYRPALLNLAVVIHLHLHNRSLALQKYHAYLALQPRPADWEAVDAAVRQLELESSPPGLASSSPTAQRSVKTNVTAESGSLSSTRVGSGPVTPAVSTARTNVVMSTSPAKIGVSSSSSTNPVLMANRTLPVEAFNKTLPASTTKVSEVEVTRLPDELVVKRPQDISGAPSRSTLSNNSAEKVLASSPVLVARENTKSQKRGIFERLNPFGGKPKRAPTNSTAPTDLPNVAAESKVGAARADQAAAEPLALLPIARYTYLSPTKPAAGNRPEAARYFALGVKAQKSARYAQAQAEYQKAIQLDPAYFEAHYNQGWVAHQAGNWKQSLAAYEYALALKPDSLDARYNLALVLKQANFPQDAADELIKLLQENPVETRVHFSLANLYAQQLNQPALARAHYLKVLQYDSRHPESAQIRYWLAANP